MTRIQNSTPSFPQTIDEVKQTFFLRYEVVEGTRHVVKKERTKISVWEWLSFHVFRRMGFGICHISANDRDILMHPERWCELKDYGTPLCALASRVVQAALPHIGPQSLPSAPESHGGAPAPIESNVQEPPPAGTSPQLDRLAPTTEPEPPMPPPAPRAPDSYTPSQEIFARLYDENQKKPQLQAIFEGTRKICEQCGYWIDGRPFFWSEETERAAQSGTEFSLEPPCLHPGPGSEHTKVSVVNGDAFDVAKTLRDKNYHTAVLNLANKRHAAGGAAWGETAQEESLTRCSTLSQSIGYTQRQGRHKVWFCPNQCLYTQIAQNASVLDIRVGEYGIPEFGTIFSRDVIVFRESEEKGFALRSDPFAVDVISAAAYSVNPESGYNFDAPLKPGYTVEFERRPNKRPLAITFNPNHLPVAPLEAIDIDRLQLGLRRKLQAILRTARNHGEEALVLGAIGCGVFDNPERTNRAMVISLLHELLKEDEFRGVFKEIKIAVFGSSVPGSLYSDFKNAFDGFNQEQQSESPEASPFEH